MRKTILLLGLLMLSFFLSIAAESTQASSPPPVRMAVERAPAVDLQADTGLSSLPALQETAAAPDTPTPRGRPVRTPRPSPTPLTIPPPSDPESASLMIGFGTLVVIVIIAGVWMNRTRAG